MFINKILVDIMEWLLACIKVLPEAIVTTIMITALVKFIGSVYDNICNRLKKAKDYKISKRKKISSTRNSKYTIKPSPKYEFNRHKGSYVLEPGYIIAGVIVFSILGIQWLKENYLAVQFLFLLASVVFICVGSLFIAISTFTNRIQSSTLKFSIFSVLISFYIYKIGLTLPIFVEEMRYDINLSNIIIDGALYWPSVYVFLGLMVVIFECFIILIMFARLLAIKIDSIWKDRKFIHKIVFYTEWLEKWSGLIIIFVLLTVVSYLLTSGIIVEHVFL